MSDILSLYPGYKPINDINEIFTTNSGYKTFSTLSSDEIQLFRYAPCTCGEVERSFSIYNEFSRPNRSAFKNDNCSKMFFKLYNLNLLHEPFKPP